MATTWVICGAGRGVGKTHLAKRLCTVLPHSVYAKRGCGKRRGDGPSNFFQTDEELEAFAKRRRSAQAHIVVECNSWVREGRGDVIIFVDGISERTNIRGDVETLRDRSHIQIGPSASIRDWKRVLRDKLDDNALREAVCDVLAEQKRHVCKGRPEVKVKVWFVEGGMHVFGAGLARLLEQIDRRGTLREAAKAVPMSYRYAWGLIRNAEKHSGKPLVLPQPGGVGGGRSVLSNHGRYLLTRYRRISQEVAALADGVFRGGGDGETP